MHTRRNYLIRPSTLSEWRNLPEEKKKQISINDAYMMNSTLKKFNKAVKKLEEEKDAGTKKIPTFGRVPIFTVTFDDSVNQRM
jgi:hypothetical protein